MEVDQIQTEYFTSYEDLEIHRLMIEDDPRTHAYKKAILNNKSYFKDKVVMDVGCGTGILSVFCAQAGAKKVYAVEASNLANLATEIVKENNFEDVIEVIHSRVEDVTLPNNTKVDAIVSEWMGFYLLHEGMLDSVLKARDKFLKEDGEMFPDSAVIYVAPCSVPSLYKRWDNVHGVSMRSFAAHLRRSKCHKPEIQTVNPEELLGTEVAMSWINLKEDMPSDVDSYSIQHVFGAKRNISYQGIAVWFDCFFPNLSSDEEAGRVILGTGPFSLPTHWKQTVIVLPEPQTLEEGEPIAFQLDMTRDKEYFRRYNLEVTMLDPEVIEHPVPCSCHMTKCIIINKFIVQHPEQLHIPTVDDKQTSDDDDDDDDQQTGVTGDDKINGDDKMSCDDKQNDIVLKPGDKILGEGVVEEQIGDDVE